MHIIQRVSLKTKNSIRKRTLWAIFAKYLIKEQVHGSGVLTVLLGCLPEEI